MSNIKRVISQADREIILALADNGLNASAVARKMQYHRNSIEYHLRSIQDITGLDPRNFHDFLRLYEMAGGMANERSNNT